MRVELHIERLVLDESLLDGERIADVSMALQRALCRMFHAPGATDALRDIGRVDAIPPLSMPDHPRKQVRLGVRIANAVGQGIGLAAQEFRPARAGDRIDGRQR